MTSDLDAPMIVPSAAPSEPPADDIDASMRRLIDHVVDHVPGVLGAIVSSKDGFVLADRLPAATGSDAAAVAAMSAALLALADRMVQLTGPAPVASCHQRSADGQVFVFSIERVAVLTIMATPNADVAQISSVGHEITTGLHRIFAGPAA